MSSIGQNTKGQNLHEKEIDTGSLMALRLTILRELSDEQNWGQNSFLKIDNI